MRICHDKVIVGDAHIGDVKYEGIEFLDEDFTAKFPESWDLYSRVKEEI